MAYHSVPHARSGRPRAAFTYETPRGITCTNFESSPCTLTYTCTYIIACDNFKLPVSYPDPPTKKNLERVWTNMHKCRVQEECNNCFCCALFRDMVRTHKDIFFTCELLFGTSRYALPYFCTDTLTADLTSISTVKGSHM